MSDQPGNQTPDTPGVSETALRERTVDELRDEARDAGVESVSTMRKEELVQAIVEARGGQDGGGDGDLGAGPDARPNPPGPDTASSLKSSQEVTSPDDDPERAGRSLVTTH